MSQPFDSRDYDLERLAEKRAEILRLKTLITELCDALDGPRFDAISQRELVQRAREATR